jgi:aromatic ring-opening dioxygenase LigB subunit
MPLVYACVAPHGFPIIPDLSEDADGGFKTREAMFELGRRIRAHNPDVIVIATPHGFRVENSITLAAVARGAGTLHWGGRTLEMNIPVDARLTDEIAEEARLRNIPIAMAGFAGNRRDQSVIPLDWGVITPLWFAGTQENMVGMGHVLAHIFETTEFTETVPPVVIANPERSLPRSTMVEFGKAIAEAAERDSRRIVSIASCDWAHTHKTTPAHDAHPDAPLVDQLVVDALSSNNPGALAELPEEKVQNAAIDGLWQTLMLAGAMELVPLAGEVLSYEAPDYYGMIVASFERVSQ